jgi:transcriptional regulator GlxA family with amidase domain
MDIRSTTPPITVGILPIDGFALMSYAAVVEPLRAANALSRRHLYETVIFSVDGTEVRSSSAAHVVAQAKVGDSVKLDLLFVIAGGDPLAFRDRKVLEWLRRLARTRLRIGGVSGGPVILARAGLMRGRRMTVHWEHIDALMQAFLDLTIERSLYVIDRDRLTCAGGIAPLDLMRALISSHYGPQLALEVSDWLICTEFRPSQGPQRSGLAERHRITNQAVLDAVAAMEDHIADPLTLSQLANFAQVSPRQLNRLFSAKLGQSTMSYYAKIRLETAHRLLRSSTLSLTDIALAAGFANSSHFSKTYSAQFGDSPSRLRASRLASDTRSRSTPPRSA